MTSRISNLFFQDLLEIDMRVFAVALTLCLCPLLISVAQEAAATLFRGLSRSKQTSRSTF